MNSIPQASTTSLVWSLIISILLAGAILLIAVLPAEYNIDPTGIGKSLGLTVLSQSGEIEEKQQLISCPETMTEKQAEAVIDNPETTLNHDHDHENDHTHEHKHDQGHSHDHDDEHHHDHLPQWKDTIVITVPPGKGLEYKFYISKGEKLEFVWETDGSALYFDFHGEPEGDKTGYFKSFKESTQNQSSGTLSVPFSGSHGWYWKNKTNQAVKITLKTRGQYKALGLM